MLGDDQERRWSCAMNQHATVWKSPITRNFTSWTLQRMRIAQDGRHIAQFVVRRCSAPMVLTTGRSKLVTVPDWAAFEVCDINLGLPRNGTCCACALKNQESTRWESLASQVCSLVHLTVSHTLLLTLAHPITPNIFRWNIRPLDRSKLHNALFNSLPFASIWFRR